MMKNIILASGSAARQDMLSNAGVSYGVTVADIDENSLRRKISGGPVTPEDTALGLAIKKAQSVSEQHLDALIIGGDQILEHNGDLLGKCASLAAARARLASFRASPHRLISAVSVVHNSRVLWSTVDTATIWFQQFSDHYLDQHIANSGRAILNSVACYELEGTGSRLVSRLDGDYFTVLGMPLFPLLNYLSETGMIEG